MLQTINKNNSIAGHRSNYPEVQTTTTSKSNKQKQQNSKEIFNNKNMSTLAEVRIWKTFVTSIIQMLAK